MDNYTILTINTKKIIKCRPEFKITSENDALEMVSACGENGTDRVIVTYSNLPDDFFNLRTGLAGGVLQKLANYFIKAAVVMPLNLIPPGRFSELVYELNKGWQFRFFDTEEPAIKWLASF